MHSHMRHLVTSWIPAAAAAAAIVMTAAAPRAQQAAPPGATIRVTPADGQPPDSLRLGQPFNVRADIPEDWNPGPTVNVELRDGAGDTHTVTLTRTGSANGVATFATAAPESIGGTRGGTLGVFGFKTAGTIDAFDDLSNGGGVTASLQGFRGPQASNVSTSVPVYDDEIQQGIARNDATLAGMENMLKAQEAGLTGIDTAGMPPDVKAEYDAALADVRMRLAWIGEARTVLSKHDTPRGDLDIGNTYLSLITQQDFGALDPRFVKSDATHALTERLENIVPDMLVSGMTAVTLANYKIVADLSGAGAAYRAGQLVTDPVLEWLGHNPGFARDEFGRPITTGQQVWAVFEVGANVAGIFAGPKLIDWLAGQGMLRGATPKPGTAGVAPDVTPPMTGTPRPPATAGRGGSPGAPGAPGANTSGTLRDPLAGATEPGALRQPAAGGAADDTLRVPRRQPGANPAGEAAQIENLVQQAQVAGVPQGAIQNALRRPTNADAIKQLQGEIATANQIQADYARATRMDAIEGLTEARNAAAAAGVPNQRIVTILTQPNLNAYERVRLLAHETLSHQGYRLTVTSAEFTQINGIYVRARTGNMTQADIEYLHAAVRADPNYFSNLSRSGRLDTDNGFDAILPPNAARELRDIYDGLAPRPAADPTRMPPVAPPFVTTGSNPPAEGQQAPGAPQQPPPAGSTPTAESRLTPGDQKRLAEVRDRLGASTDPEDKKLLAELNELFAGPNAVLAVMRLGDVENILDLDPYRHEDPSNVLDAPSTPATPATPGEPSVPPTSPLPDGTFIDPAHVLDPSNAYDAAVIAELEASGYGHVAVDHWTTIAHVDGTFEYINRQAGAVRVAAGGDGRVTVTGKDLRPGSVADDAMRPHITDEQRAAIQQEIDALVEIARAGQQPPPAQRGACGYALWCAAEEERKRKEAEAAAAQPPQRYMCGYQMACEAERQRKEAEAAAAAEEERKQKEAEAAATSQQPYRCGYQMAWCEAERKRKEAEAAAAGTGGANTTGGTVPNAPAGTGTMQSGDGAPVQTGTGDRDQAVQVMIIEVRFMEAPPPPRGRDARAPSRLTPRSLWQAAARLFARPQPLASYSPRPGLGREPSLAAPIMNIVNQAPAGSGNVRTVLTSLGTSTGEAFQLQVLNEGNQAARIGSGILVVEPLKSAVKQKAQKEIAKIAARSPITSRVNGYCLEFLRQPPAAGTLFRVASQELQQKFEPMRRIVDVANRLQQSGLLNPDSDPVEYFHSIKQWALWTKEQTFTLDTFRTAFLDHAKKNMKAAGRQWSAQIEDAVAGLVPGRWQDIAKVLTAAGPAPAPGAGAR